MIKQDIIHILDNIVDKNKFSNMEMNYYFNLKNYSLQERAFVKNILNLTIKNLIYLDYIIDNNTKNIAKRKTRQILRMSLAQAFYTESDIAGIVYEAVELAKTINIQQAKFVNATLKKMIASKKIIDERIERENLINIKYSLPKFLVDKIFIDWGEYLGLEYIKSSKSRSYLSVRIDSNKITKEEFKKRIGTTKTKIVYEVDDKVFYLSNYEALDRNLFDKGEVYIQDASSYLVAKNIKANESSIILDACSAPGGKSLAMYNLYNPKKLVSCDIYDSKLESLEELKDNLGLDRLEIKKQDATVKEEGFKFSHILLDVPCSGLGVLKRKPEKAYTISLQDIKKLKKLQKKIFETNIDYLESGGYLIYSTCTFTKNENTNNVEYFINKYNLKVEELEIPSNIEVIKDQFGGVYISPKNSYLDSFYIIKFRKG